MFFKKQKKEFTKKYDKNRAKRAVLENYLFFQKSSFWRFCAPHNRASREIANVR